MSLFPRKGAKNHKAVSKQVPEEEELLKGAEKSVTAILSWSYLVGLHRQMAAEAFRRLLSTPVASFMSCLMIALAFVLPALFYLFVANIQQLEDGWGGSPRVSLYLEGKISQRQLHALNEQIASNTLVASSVYISPEEGLSSFQKQAGIADIATELGFNPLPGVLQLDIRVDTSYKDLASLAGQLKAFSGVDQVRLDKKWIERLKGIARLLEQAGSALALLLGLTIWLAISNTVGLSIEARKNELKVVKLVGGTDGFIMLPFVYMGIIYGVAGAILAVLIVWAVLMAMMSPIVSLVGLYEGSFQVVGPDATLLLALVVAGILLGGCGAWVSCYKHLKSYVPC